MGDDIEEFISLIGIKNEIILKVSEIEEHHQLLLSKYIQERVSILINNKK